jgi:hypothetical protein
MLQSPSMVEFNLPYSPVIVSSFFLFGWYWTAVNGGSDFLQIGRELLYCLGFIILFLFYLLNSFLVRDPHYLLWTIAGVCFTCGMFWSIIPMTVSEVFELKTLVRTGVGLSKQIRKSFLFPK